MLNRNWLMSDRQQRLARKCSASQPALSAMGLTARSLSVLLLLALVLLLSACPGPLVRPCVTPPPVSEPALTEPLPLVDYSLTAKETTSKRQQKLDAMHLTLKPATTLSGLTEK